MHDYALPPLKAFFERSVRVPKDIAIIGMMDTYLDTQVHSALTSVRFVIKTMRSSFTPDNNGIRSDVDLNQLAALNLVVMDIDRSERF